MSVLRSRDRAAAAVEAALTRAGLTADAVAWQRLDGSAATPAQPPDFLYLGTGAAYPASMIKTPLAVAVAACVDADRLRWDTPFAVGDAVLTANDAPSPLVAGAVTTVAEALDLMLSRSDNVATNVLIDAAGREAATADLVRLGFHATAIRRKLSGSLPLIADPQATGRNTHPAADALALFVRLDSGELPGAARIRRALANQWWNAKLSAGLEPGDRFEHKTGDTDEVSHDGGILHLATGRRFALVVYTAQPSNDATDAAFGRFMRGLRPILSA